MFSPIVEHKPMQLRSVAGKWTLCPKRRAEIEHLQHILEQSRRKLQPEVMEAFMLLDEDKSKMLDMDELYEGFAALGISRTDRQVRKALAKLGGKGLV